MICKQDQQVMELGQLKHRDLEIAKQLEEIIPKIYEIQAKVRDSN